MLGHVTPTNGFVMLAVAYAVLFRRQWAGVLGHVTPMTHTHTYVCIVSFANM